ncbi:MAG: EAL domain-containing protein [Sulfurimicrobium sp.]|nr:EAL domain-containing protein [Sulfurimicrobium sp.]MDP2198400.1 EAL domain-containing protein [Sulfurimicrobium sp.]
MNGRTRLKTVILLPLALVLAGLLGMFYSSLYQHEKESADQDFVSAMQAAQTYYQRSLDRHGEKLGAALEAIVRDETLQAALRAKDRGALLDRAGPLFERLRERYGVTHFYFEDANRVNVLRVHQPERHGDTINRYTTLTAEKSGEIASGVELGPIGTFTLRMVAPMRDEQGLVGYVELGEELEEVLQGVRMIIGVELVLLIDKQFLKRKSWEEGMRMLKRRADWEHLPDAAIIHQTLDLPAASVASVLSRAGKGGRDFKIDDKHYYAGVIPVSEAGGRAVGKMILLRDKTRSQEGIHATMRSVSLYYLPVGALLFAMFYLIIRGVQQRLESSHQQLVEQGREREALQAQHIAELKDERDKLRLAKEELQHREEDLRLSAKVFENSIEGIMITDVKSNILRVNRAFTTITGYSEEEAVGNNTRLMRSDRHDGAFYQAMWNALVKYGYWQGEIWNRRKSGEVYPEWLSIVAVRNEQGETLNYLGIFADLSEKKTAEARAHHLAYYDPLTELPNRALLDERLKQAMAAVQNSGGLAALLHIDLDRFKAVNDTLGHAFGDRLLQALSERLAGSVRGSDTVARLGSDEFAVLLADVGDKQCVERVCGKIFAALAEPFDLGVQEIFVTLSVGIALCPFDADSAEDLIRNADVAMSYAKTQGGNDYHFYTPGMSGGEPRRLILETSLRRALERDEFLLHYQPQICLQSGRITGVEALLRWQHPERGLVSPAEFIPLLEEIGLIVPVGEWVLRTACIQNRAWVSAGLPPLRMAVNLSARQFRQGGLADMVSQALNDSGLAPEWLELEVTESILIQDLQATITTLRQLDTLGILISIDDFGTGYSSLSYLKHLPISKIKIDRSFVRDICSDPDDAAITNAVISLGHSLKLRVVAEGVETLAQLEYLRAQGCDEVQGFYFSRPLPAEEFAVLAMKSETGI